MISDRALARLAEDSFPHFPEFLPGSVKMAEVYGFIPAHRICDLVDLVCVNLTEIGVISRTAEYITMDGPIVMTRHFMDHARSYLSCENFFHDEL